MKKIKTLLCLLLSCVLTFSFTTHAYDPTANNYSRFLNTMYFVQDPNNLAQIEWDMIGCVEVTTPYEIQELFKQEGVRIYLCKGISRADRYDNELGGYDAITYSASLTWNGSKKITNVNERIAVYIYDNTTDVTAYYHEFGHVFDDLAEYITGYYKGVHPISSSSEWKVLYDQNVNILSRFDAQASINVPKNACEGFAEAYRLYFVYPGALQNNCPEVYSFVAAQINKYTGYLKPLTYDTFDAFDYYISYPDVAEAVGLDRKGLWDHYVNCGKAEGRIARREAR